MWSPLMGTPAHLILSEALRGSHCIGFRQANQQKAAFK